MLVTRLAKNSVPYLRIKIDGVPYPKIKSRGDKQAPKRWTAAVVAATGGLPKVKDACLVRVTYLIPRRNVPKDIPYGTDIDNLNKRFFDALSQTIFSEAKGRDSCVIALEAMKVVVESDSDAGAALEVLPVQA
jgi:hypothetical protein